MPLSPAALHVLRAMHNAQTLKVHRDLDGHKAYRLHALDGMFEPVVWAVAEELKNAGVIESNQKFPAATFWITAAGRALLDDV